MAKKTTGTRLNKKEVRNRLLVVFEHSAGATYNVKSLFRAVGAVNHPAKMLVLDTLADLHSSVAYGLRTHGLAERGR